MSDHTVTHVDKKTCGDTHTCTHTDAQTITHMAPGPSKIFASECFQEVL